MASEKKHKIQIRELFGQKEDFSPVSIEIEKGKLQPPLLAHIGILDINHVFNLLPNNSISQLGSYPNLSPNIFPFIYELKNKTCRILGLGTKRLPEPSRLPVLYPIVCGGFIDQISETKLFNRLFGVSQLSFHPHFPLNNEHSRGHHSIHVAINMARTMQTLSNNSPEILEERLRRDFTQEPFYDPKFRQEEVFKLAVNLAVLTAMEHDQATPAGGDAIKYITGIDEEEVVKWLFLGDHKILEGERSEFLELLKNHNLTSDHLRFAINCIQGKSNSLIGDLIHPKFGDYLDWDRFAYTSLDTVEVSAFHNELPARLLPKKLSPFEISGIKASLDRLIASIEDPSIFEAHGLGTREPTPTISFIDPTEDFVLDINGNIVNVNPEKLAWVAAIRLIMTVHYYMGEKLLGYETEIQERLKELIKQDQVSGLLTLENLITLTNDEFRDKVIHTDPGFSALLGEKHRLPSSVEFKYTSQIQERDKAGKPWASFPIKIKPGLDSKVIDNGEIITLKEYITRYPSLDSAVIIQKYLAMLGKERVIWKVTDEIPFIPRILLG